MYHDANTKANASTVKDLRSGQRPEVKGLVKLSGLRQFFATVSPLKMMKNAFYFTVKALFVLKIFKFLS